MDFQPGTLLELPFLADFIRIATTAFAGAALVAAGAIVVCVCKECKDVPRQLAGGAGRMNPEL